LLALSESLKCSSSAKECAIGTRPYQALEHRADPGISIWKEALCGIDYFLLYSSPVYYGFDVPLGDGSAVVVIPGFLQSDSLVRGMHSWLRRIGYRPYLSGIGLNSQCPNLLIEDLLMDTISKAVADTRRRIHLIGHSLGGIIAHSVAVRRPDDIASIITLGSPIRGTVVQRDVFSMAEGVRKRILKEHGHRVSPNCYTSHCNCEFSKSLRRRPPASVIQTAIYTCNDGIVDWRYCLSDDPQNNFEVPGTHLGLLFNQSVYKIISKRLHEARAVKKFEPRRGTRI
jgi:triacylglycerol lipase